jgi:hypothetical protein
MNKAFFLLIFCFPPFQSSSFAQQEVWLDSDTGDEVYDLFAISYLVKAPVRNRLINKHDCFMFDCF